MRYKVEMWYMYGWDDAGWTEEKDGVSKPMRFRTKLQAQAELNNFFAEVKNAVASGDMDVEETPEDYRIVPILKTSHSNVLNLLVVQNCRSMS